MRAQRQKAVGRARRAKGLAPLLAALVAVFLQALVVQTHVHGFALAAPAIERSDAAHAGGDHVASAHHATACVFCEALRSSGRSVLPPVADIAGARQVIVEAEALTLPATPQTLSHAWRSRAPPQAV